MSDVELYNLALASIDRVPSFPRDVAGEILRRVGDAGSYGGILKPFDPTIIGIAVRRVVKNYGDDDWMEQFLCGLTHRRRAKNKLRRSR